MPALHNKVSAPTSGVPGWQAAIGWANFSHFKVKAWIICVYNCHFTSSTCQTQQWVCGVWWQRHRTLNMFRSWEISLTPQQFSFSLGLGFILFSTIGRYHTVYSVGQILIEAMWCSHWTKYSNSRLHVLYGCSAPSDGNIHAHFPFISIHFQSSSLKSLESLLQYNINLCEFHQSLPEQREFWLQ